MADRQYLRDVCFLARGMLEGHIDEGREHPYSANMAEAKLLVDRGLAAADRFTATVAQLEKDLAEERRDWQQYVHETAGETVRADAAEAQVAKLEQMVRDIVRLTDGFASMLSARI